MNSQQSLPKFAVPAFFVFAALLLGLGLGRSGFEGKDERRYAQVSKEIGPGRDFFVMHLLGDLYPDKPPLFFWTQAAAYKIMGGTTPLAARLPLLISALGALAFAYFFIRRLEGDVAALAGTALILLSFRFFWSARWARLDMPMTALTFGSFWASARLLFPRPDEGDSPRDHWRWAMLAWFFGALTILSKGPGVLVWMGAVTTFAAVRRDFGIIRKHHPLAGFAFMLALACAWFVPAALMGGREYWGPMLKVHVVQRVVGVVRHDQPFYYYAKIVYDAFPMGLFLPASLWLAWRARKADPEGGTAFSFWAFVFGFVFFSLPAGKRGQYILPLYLPMGALTGRLIAEALSASDGIAKRIGQMHAALLAAVMLGGAFAAPWLYALVAADFQTIPGEDAYLAASVGFLLILIPALLLAYRGRIASSLAVSLGLCAALYLALFLFIIPANRSDDGPREIARMVDADLGSWKQLGLFAVDEKFTLYGREMPALIKNSQEAIDFMHKGGRRWLLAPERKLPRFLDASGNIPWRRIGEWPDPIDGRKLILFDTGP